MLKKVNKPPSRRSKADVLIELLNLLSSKRIKELWVMCVSCTRENKGTERDTEGVGWVLSIPLKLFIEVARTEVCFPETPA